MTGSPYSFQRARDRDARPAIRGFVYQVDLTLLRWLELGADDVLELEHGEDIDRVTSAAGIDEADRLLEQIKHSEPRLTLRSASAKSALANFFEHRRTNAVFITRLRFRFTTNARIGRERPSPIRIAAIDAWESLRSSSIQAADRAATIAGLRSLLAEASRPDGTSTSLWRDFTAWTRDSSDDEFVAFVRAFEWATAAPDLPSLEPQIREKLLLLGLVTDDDQASSAHQRLFHAVFQLLCERGSKTLTRELLARELNQTPDRISILATRFEEYRSSTSGRLEIVESRLDAMSAALMPSDEAISELAQRAGITASFNLGAIICPPIEPPLPLNRSTRRSTTVGGVLESHPRPLIVALHGAAKSGKTQLAHLLATSLGDSQGWIRLSGLAASPAGQRLVVAVGLLLDAAGSASRSLRGWPSLCTAAAQTRSVLVFDDVPEFGGDDELGTRLGALINACMVQGTSVVVTSTVPLRAIGALFDGARTVFLAAPPFTSDEVREVLAAYDAPRAFLNSGNASFVEAISRGHPTLVHAVAQFLVAKGWSMEDGVFAGLLSRQYAHTVNRETLRALLNEVSDEPTRELLYRLHTVGGQFTLEDAAALAAVPPELATRQEALARLIGPWIEERDTNQFAVSPLVEALPDTALTAAVQQRCHRVLAQRIVARRSIGELEAVDAIRHYFSAGEPNGAAMVLLQALHALYFTRNAVLRGRIITGIWRDLPLPVEMDVGLRVVIRAFQTVLAVKDGRDPDSLVADLVTLLRGSPAPPVWAEWMACLLVAFNLASSHFRLAAPMVGHVLRAWPVVRADAEARELTVGFPSGIESLVWILSANVRDDGDLLAWVQSLQGQEADVYDRAFGDAMGVAGATRLAELPFLWENQKPVADRNWQPVVARLEWLEGVARSWRARPLVAACISARFSCLAESGEPTTTLTTAANEAMEEFRHEGDGSFLIAQALGNAALDSNHTDVALSWFRRADSTRGSQHTSMRLRAKLRIAQLLASSDPRASLAAADAAVAFVNSEEVETLRVAQLSGDASELPRTAAVSALGELAMACARAGDRERCSTALLAMIEGLIATRSDTDERWKALFVTAGHVAGYLTSIVTTGTPPDVMPTGEEYFAPPPGVLILPRLANAARFDPAMVDVLGVQAMMVAEAIGDDDACLAWAERSAASLVARNMWDAAYLPTMKLASHAVIAGEYALATDLGINVAAIAARRRGRSRESRQILSQSEAPRTSAGERSGGAESAWAEIDAFALSEIVLPSFLRVATVFRRNAAEGVIAATQLRDACLLEAAQQDLPQPEIAATLDPWLETARMLEDIFVRPVARDLIFPRSRAFSSSSHPSKTALTIMAYIGVSMLPSTAVSERAALHLAVAEAIQTGLRDKMGLYDSIALPFFEDYWRSTFAESRAIFATPRLAERGIASALSQPAPVRLQFLLRVICEHLGVRLFPEARAWFGAATTGSTPP